MGVQKPLCLRCRSLSVVQLLKSWEYKNRFPFTNLDNFVVQLLKSWEYKNTQEHWKSERTVVQLLKSWEYKNYSKEQLTLQVYRYSNYNHIYYSSLYYILYIVYSLQHIMYSPPIVISEESVVMKKIQDTLINYVSCIINNLEHSLY